MGACCSCLTDVLPSDSDLLDIADDIVSAKYYQFYNEYQAGMKKEFPKKYVCKEVIDKKEEGGHHTLLYKTSTDEDIKKAAKAATLGEEGKKQVQDEVWEEHIKPGAKEKLSCLPYGMKAASLKATQEACDKAVEALWDKVRDRLAKKMAAGAVGEEKPQPNKKPADESETHATEGGE